MLILPKRIQHAILMLKIQGIRLYKMARYLHEE